MNAFYYIALVVICITTLFSSAAAAADDVFVKDDGHYSSTSLNFAAAADGGFVKDDGTSINKFTPRRRRVMFDKKTTNGVVPNKAPEGEDELAGCLADGEQPGAQVGNCCNSYHLGPMGLYTSCGPDPSCGGKGTLCYPITDTNTHSCTKCCNSWSWYFTGPYCD